MPESFHEDPSRFLIPPNSIIVIKKPKQAKTTTYLDEAASFMKLNYKCPKGTYDEGFGCGPSEKEEQYETDPESFSDNNKEKESLEEYERRYFAKQRDLDKRANIEYTPIKKSLIDKFDELKNGPDNRSMFVGFDISVLKKQDGYRVHLKYPGGYTGRPESLQDVIEHVDRLMIDRIHHKLEKDEQIAYAKEHTRPSVKFPPKSEAENQLINNSYDLIKTISDSEKSDLDEYSTQSYYITEMLINNPEYDAKWKDPFDINANRKENIIATMDKLISKSVISSPMTVYSGISKEYFDKIIKNSNKPFKTVTFMSTSRDETIAEGFAEQSRKMANEGYITVSGKKPKPANENIYVAEIRLAPGTPALSLEKYYDVDKPYLTFNYSGKNRPIAESREVVLARNSRYKVLGTEKHGNINKVILTNF